MTIVCRPNCTCDTGRGLLPHDPPPNHKRRRTLPEWTSAAISKKVCSIVLHPLEFPNLDKSPDGSFSLDSLMNCWGNAEGLSPETVLQAIASHLVIRPRDNQRGPSLRFSVEQSRQRRGPILIRPNQA